MILPPLVFHGLRVTYSTTALLLMATNLILIVQRIIAGVLSICCLPVKKVRKSKFKIYCSYQRILPFSIAFPVHT
jgi:hypothetical protein